MRIALGYDLHRLKNIDQGFIPCGGIKIPCNKSIDGAHSDGDVVLHALTDAILSLFGTDIGIEFPNTDPINKNRNSIDFLEHALKKLTLGSYHIENIDIIVICDTPKLIPYRIDIQNNLATILNISKEQISIRGKTTENTRPNTIEAYINVLFKKQI